MATREPNRLERKRAVLLRRKRARRAAMVRACGGDKAVERGGAGDTPCNLYDDRRGDRCAPVLFFVTGFLRSVKAARAGGARCWIWSGGS